MSAYDIQPAAVSKSHWPGDTFWDRESIRVGQLRSSGAGTCSLPFLCVFAQLHSLESQAVCWSLGSCDCGKHLDKSFLGLRVGCLDQEGGTAQEEIVYLYVQLQQARLVLQSSVVAVDCKVLHRMRVVFPPCKL